MYIIELTKTIHHEGDQRSRDFPGHGYPACDETISFIQKYEKYEDMEVAIGGLCAANIKFKLYEATEMRVNTRYVIDIKK